MQNSEKMSTPTFHVPVVFALSLCVLLNACDESGARKQGDATRPTAEDVLRSYAGLEQATPQPVMVNPALAMLCRGANQSEVEEARRKHGPHAHSAITVYMNAPALAALHAGSP